MALWLDGWAGDHAGNVVGRNPNTLLVAASFERETGPPANIDMTQEWGGITIHPAFFVDCLSPNAAPAYVTKIRYIAGQPTYEAELAMIEDPAWTHWAPGVHLFTVQLHDREYNWAHTFATAVINDDVSRLTFHREETWQIWELYRNSVQQYSSVHTRPGPDIR
jgi:hypothetical protein